MTKPILTSTTNSVEGATIEKYIDLIAVNVVLGTNFFSDIGASFTDLFGGASDSYQSKLEKIYKVGIDKLKSKAITIGANAIIGVKIDFDEISGGGKSMFMLSVAGTAVRIRYNEAKREDALPEKPDSISSETLAQEVTKRLVISKVQNNILPSPTDWSYLLTFPVPEISGTLLDVYLKCRYNSSDYPDEKVILAHLPNYLSVLEEDQAKELLYGRLGDKQELIVELLISCNVFSAAEIIKLIKNDKVHTAIKCLGANKNYYSHGDLSLMREMVSLFENLKDLGRIETVKGILGKEKEKYICPEGHKNKSDVIYCSEFLSCGKNIKGLTEDEVKKINLFKLKVEALSSVLSNS